MKIDSTTNSKLDSLSGRASRTQQDGSAASAPASAGSAASTPSPASAGGDASVSLSGLSSDLRSAAASDSGDINTAHVEAIKSAIANGTLTIDPGKIADGVLETTRSLLQTRAPATGN